MASQGTRHKQEATGASARGTASGSESSLTWLARLVPALTALVGLAGSLLLLWSLRSGELATARASFALDSSEGASDVAREFDLAVEQVESIVSLFAASELVERGEFRDFTRRSLARYRPLRLLAWVTDPTHGGLPSFTVRYGEGPAATASLLDSDLGTQPELRAAFERARTAAGPVLSAPLPGLTAPEEQWVAILLPAFSRQEGEQGFVVGFLELAAFFQGALAHGPPQLRWSLADITAETLLLVGQPPVGEPTYAEPLAYGGRVWRIASCAPPDFFAQHTSWKPWGAFLLGLACTALLVSALAFATSRARIRQLVQRRSQEVEAAYDTLAHEAQQRLWAMTETRQLQRRLRQIIDLVPNWIYVKDRFGRFLLANQATAEAYGTSVDKLTAPSAIDFNADNPESDEILKAERALVDEQRSEITGPHPFRDAHGRRRLLRTAKIPCVFEDETKALLCVASDVTEQELATHTLRSQNRILGELARGGDPDAVLAELVLAAEALVPDMRCSVLLRSPDGQRLQHGFGPSLPDFYNSAVDGLRIGPGVGSCGAAAHSGQRVVVEDVSQHPNWAAYRELARRAEIGACWSQPIRSAEGEILGTFAMYYSRPRGPDESEVRLIESWAHLAGIAIERRRQVAGN